MLAVFHFIAPWIQTARSFVILPCSTVSIHTVSSAMAKNQSMSLVAIQLTAKS